MDKLTFVSALFFLIGANKINGDKPSVIPQIYSGVVEIAPPDILYEPIFETNPPPPYQQINGRLLTPAEGCGHSSKASPRIVGGGPARIGAYPWIALLGYKELVGQYVGMSFKCGGSLITSKHVLTAKHCILPNLWFARFGEHDWRTNSDGRHKDVEIAEVLQHKEYNQSLHINDLAILRLVTDVEFNDRIRPICLPINEEMRSYNFTGANPFAAGWGATGKGQATYLKHVQAPVVDVDTCNEVFARNRYTDIRVDEMTVCAGGVEGQSICSGDSGGPLFLPVHVGNGKYSFYQIGVSSWVIFPCGFNRELPSGFMRVQYFADWIESMINSSNHKTSNVE